MENPFKKKTQKTLNAELRDLAERAKVEGWHSEAIILFALLGSKESGSISELAGICVQFARAELIRIEAIKESRK